MFQNTEIAFAAKTDTQLKKAHFLFATMGNNLVVKTGTHLLKTAFKIHLPIKWIVKQTIFEQFCGGESIKDCESSISTLGAYNVGTILDYSVEGEATDKAFDATKDEVIRTILKSKTDKNIPFSVFKPTGVGRFAIYEKMQAGTKLKEIETQELAKIRIRFDEICKTAYENNVSLLIDAEETWIQDAIDELVLEMMEKYNKEKAIVHNTIQFYRASGLEILQKQHQVSIEKGFFYGLKMVRGAYMEQERTRAKEKNYTSPIHINKTNTDQCYNDGLKYCIANFKNISLCAGTHNEDSNELLTKLLEVNSIEKNNSNVFFAQLYGMSDHISFNLAKLDYNVAKYVPYGPVKAVVPYLIRRAEENTSVAGQMGRELSLIKKELQRRKIILKS